MADAATGRLIGGQAWGHEAVAERMLAALAPDQSVLVLPMLSITKSNEHARFAGTLNDETHFLSEGYPMGVFYGYYVEGIFADQEDVDAHPEQTVVQAAPGEYK